MARSLSRALKIGHANKGGWTAPGRPAGQTRSQALQSRTSMRLSASIARREFLKFVAASPYVAALGGVATFLERSLLAQSAQQASGVILDPAGALAVCG